MKNLTTTYIRSLVNSTDPFPVDLDELWLRVGFDSKTTAQRKVRVELRIDVEYTTQIIKKPQRSPLEVYKLTLDASLKLCRSFGSEKALKYLSMVEEVKKEQRKKNKKNGLKEKELEDKETNPTPTLYPPIFFLETEEGEMLMGPKSGVPDLPLGYSGREENPPTLELPRKSLSLEEVDKIAFMIGKRFGKTAEQKYLLVLLDIYSPGLVTDRVIELIKKV